jgi:hypothetical protein
MDEDAQLMPKRKKSSRGPYKAYSTDNSFVLPSSTKYYRRQKSKHHLSNESDVQCLGAIPGKGSGDDVRANDNGMSPPTSPGLGTESESSMSPQCDVQCDSNTDQSDHHSTGHMLVVRMRWPCQQYNWFANAAWRFRFVDGRHINSARYDDGDAEPVDAILEKSDMSPGDTDMLDREN